MLVFANVTKTFGDIKALEDVSFEVDDGEFIYLTGPSGAGKSTIIKLILREIVPDQGEIILDGVDITKLKRKEISKLRQKIGVVFQDFKMINDKTVRENIETALAICRVDWGEWRERVEHVAKLVGIEDRLDLFPSQLAGGEIQRASLARALVINPSIILADEPTGNLDWDTAEKIVELFEKINHEGKTIIMATHNRQILEKFKKRVIFLERGKIISDSGKKEKAGKNQK